jgi:putative tryptophan/tyrosine transport system substrate-binding protein
MQEAPIMRRTIGLLVIFALGLLVVSRAAEAQPAGKIPRLGVLFPAELPSPEEPSLAAFRQALQQLGYVEGQTVAMESRYALGRPERMPELVAELVRLQVDVLVVGSTPAAVAAKQATQAIPIVFIGSPDPMGSGLVASLARPGGNLTGFSFAFSEGFGGKWVELLKEAAPAVSQVAFLHYAANPLSTWAPMRHDVQNAAQALGLILQLFPVSEPEAIDGAFAMMTAQQTGALIVDSSPFLFTHHNRVVDLAGQHRLPAIYGFRTFVDAGGLMSYGISIGDLWRRAATYVDKILKGAKPADLPVQQPTTFELVINLKTAQALGLTIPPTLLFQATDVIR